MRIKKQIFNNSGFTLLEVTISLFIITLMIALFLANYDTGNRTNDLAGAAQKLASDIRIAQNKSLGSVAYNGSFPIGGWGVHLTTTGSNTSYIVFADLNGNQVYDSSPDEGAIAYGGQVNSLPANIIVSSIVTTVSTPSTLDITFLPPDPTTRIFDGTSTSSSATITLKQTTTGKTASLTVNVLGLIQVN
jgi:Tfp pilus assembly protein FimT